MVSAANLQRHAWCDVKPRARACQCFGISIPRPPDLPDPAIYSPQSVHNRRQSPTWNSPDIFTRPLPKIDHSYVGQMWDGDEGFLFERLERASITVHNLSTKVSAINTIAEVSFSDFGIGFPKQHRTSALCSIPPSGQYQFFARVPDDFSEQLTFVLHVTLSHPNDLDISNNVGAQAIGPAPILEGESTLHVPLRNPYSRNTSLALFTSFTGGLQGGLAQNQTNLSPNQEINIDFTIERPAGTPDESEATIYAVDKSGLVVGGITYVIYGL